MTRTTQIRGRKAGEVGISPTIILALSVTILAFGPVGRFDLSGGVFDIGLIAVWLFAWLGERGVALSFAVALGLSYDLVSFLPFGYWLVVFVLAVLLIDWLKSRFLTVSSFWQAVLVLAVVSLFYHLAISVWTLSVSYFSALVSLLLNVSFGAVLYYLLVFRLRLFQRWTGKRL